MPKKSWLYQESRWISNWDHFFKNNHDMIYKEMNNSSSKLRKDFDYILKHPPKKQCYENGYIKWQENKIFI